MKKYIQKWKKLNKNAFKLSLICGLNWLIRFLIKNQFYIFSAVFLGLLTYYIPHNIQLFTVIIVEILVLMKLLIDIVFAVVLGDINRAKVALNIFILNICFLTGINYMKQHTLTEFIVHRLFLFWTISLVLAVIVTFVQPMLFEHYLFKNVINKRYLGIRKLTDDLPPKCNLYTDADEKDADRRMTLINQTVIKQPYQGIVELSFLSREVLTGINYKVVKFEKEIERTFRDIDTIYYPVFKVYPFGLEGFGYPLIKFKLSRKEAFMEIREDVLKKDF